MLFCGQNASLADLHLAAPLTSSSVTPRQANKFGGEFGRKASHNFTNPFIKAEPECVESEKHGSNCHNARRLRGYRPNLLQLCR